MHKLQNELHYLQKSASTKKRIKKIVIICGAYILLFLCVKKQQTLMHEGFNFASAGMECNHHT